VSRLTLLLLGPPHLERDGSPLEFETRKALALLAFLAVSGERHNRDELATLLWPEYGQAQARAYLRYTLWALKKTLGETWLEIDREQVGLARREDLWVDVAHFRTCLAARRTHGHPVENVCSACLPLLAEAAALYRGDLVAGFTLTDSPAFDDWQTFHRESLQRELAGALHCLVLGQSARGEYEQAIAHARRWLALDRLHEQAHRWLMRLYAWAGEEAAALRQYQDCAQLLDAELGVSPEDGTTALYNAIKAKHAPPLPRLVEAPERLTPPPPPFLEWPAAPLEAEEITFVARQPELAQLGAFLDLALARQGRVVFVTGEAGSGKTALLREFARRALLAAADLLVTSGL
jgi:DNA-binding SARP family transcriptional activator